jgi:hypothetical protein
VRKGRSYGSEVDEDEFRGEAVKRPVGHHSTIVGRGDVTCTWLNGEVGEGR